MRGQLRLASKMTKQQHVADRISALAKKETSVDLPLSTEMSDWLTSSFDAQADDCTLPETISSCFIQPMNAMAVYCPTAAINATPFAATRISNLSIGLTVPFLPNGTFYSHRSSWNDTFSNTVIIESNEPTMEVFSVMGRTSNNFKESVGISTTNMNVTPNDPITRLNVLWLQRKAQLERESGDDHAALKTLDDAIAAHLGTDDYLQADLRGDVGSSDPIELLDKIDQDYVRYDPSVHVKATIIQRVYRKRIQRQWAAATVLSRHYRGYLTRRDLWTRNDLFRQSAVVIQKIARSHLWRRSKLAAKLQRWYMLWKQVHLYIKMRLRHRAAKCIQRYWRGYLCRSRVTIGAIRNKIMSKKIQRAFRGFLTRKRRVVGLILYHKLFYHSATTIQCLARKALAKTRRKVRCQAAESRETERCIRERDYVAALVAEDVQRTKFYFKTPAGRLHRTHVAGKITSRDALLRERSRGKIRTDELLRKQCLVAYQVLNSSGSGRLTVTELDNAFSELDVTLVSTQLAALARHIGFSTVPADISLGVDFAAFASWYSDDMSSSRQSGDGDDAATVAGIRNLLQQRLYQLEITGDLLQIRAERQIVQQSADLQRMKALAVFRRNAPPRFQCCQCRTGFAVFGAYHRHFPELGRCVASSQPALFYRKSSIFWRSQRECEEECIRRCEFKATMEYTLTRAWFAEYSVMESSSMRRLIARDVQAYISIEGKEPESTGSSPKMTRTERRRMFAKKSLSILLDSLGPFSGETQMMLLSASFLSSSLKFAQPANWVENEKYNLSSGDVRDWIEQMILPVPIGPAAVVAADDDAHAESGVGAQRKAGSSSVSLLCRQKHRERKVSPHVAAELRVKLLRLLLFVSTQLLSASGEFQHERPRAISVTDKELSAKGHEDLTLKEHELWRAELLKRIEGVRTQWRVLLAVTSTKSADDVSMRVGGGLYSAVDAAEGLVQQLELEDAYLRAHVQTKLWIQSSLGRRHVQRLSEELWVARQRFKADDAAAAAAAAAANNQVKRTSAEAKAGHVGPFKPFADSRYLFHRLVRSEWIPDASMSYHLFGSTAAGTSNTVAAIGSAALVVIGEGDPDNRATTALQSFSTSTSPQPLVRVRPTLSLFELQWLMNAMGMAVPAEKLLEVERQLDPASTGQISCRVLLDWIATNESGGFSSIVQVAANAVSVAVRMMTGTLYSEHARQVVLMAARRRARLVLQYEHQCFAEQKVGGKKAKPVGKQDKNSSGSAFDAKDYDIFHQGGDVLTQMVALRVAHDTSETSMVQMAIIEENERRHRRTRWSWHDNESHETASLTVHAMDDIIQVFGGLTRAYYASVEASASKPKEAPTPDGNLPLVGKRGLVQSESEPLLVPVNFAPVWLPGGAGGALDPWDILGVPEPQSASVVDALLSKVQETVAFLVVHLFDVTCAQSLSEDEIGALLLVLQRGVGNRELLRRFPCVRHHRASLQHMARFVKDQLHVVPEASVRKSSVLRKVFGLKKAFVARCGTGKAAAKMVALETGELLAQHRSTALRYWEAHGQYIRDRTDSFFKARADDDLVAAQSELSGQEKSPDNDLLWHHRAQLSAMQQTKLLLRSNDGKIIFAEEKDRVTRLWNGRCQEAFGYSRVGSDAELVDVLLGYAFDVFATNVLPVNGDLVGPAMGLLVTELPFLMYFCVVRLRLASNPYLGRIFAVALRLVDSDNISFLSRSHVLDLLRPAFRPHILPHGFMGRLFDQMLQPSPPSLMDFDSTAALMSRARQEAETKCFHFHFHYKVKNQ